MKREQKNKGLRRLINAWKYSYDGILAIYKSEEAFRQEVFLSLIALPISFFIAETKVEWLLLIGSMLLLMVVELLNSSIEATVDLFSKDIHPLAKVAKDAASAAVFLASIMAGTTWLVILFF